MGRNAAERLASRGIPFMLVAPAVIQTTIYTAFIKEENIPTAQKGFDSFHPIDRIDQPKDVGAVIANRMVNHSGQGFPFQR